MQDCQHISVEAAPVGMIKQGEPLVVTGRLFNGEVSVVDWTGYKIAFMVYSQDRELLFSSEQGREGILPVELNTDGTIAFRIPPEVTRTLSGTYYIEGKIVYGETVSVSDKTTAFTVIESRIGASERL